jgi:hypothetical protein
LEPNHKVNKWVATMKMHLYITLYAIGVALPPLKAWVLRVLKSAKSPSVKPDAEAGEWAPSVASVQTVL